MENMIQAIIEREMKKRDAKFSRASVFMVLLFVLCNAPRGTSSKHMSLLTRMRESRINKPDLL